METQTIVIEVAWGPGYEEVEIWNCTDGPDRIFYDLPDLSADPYLESADEEATDGVTTVAGWHLASGYWLMVDKFLDGHFWAGVYDQEENGAWPLTSHLLDWHPMDDEDDDAERLARFGCDPSHAPNWEEPESDTDGPCRIFVVPHYYPSTYRAPRPGWYRDDHDEIVVFASAAEARMVLDDYYNGESGYDGIPPSNVLAHGQYAGDTLTVVCWWADRADRPRAYAK